MRKYPDSRHRILAKVSILLAFAVFLQAFPVMAQASPGQNKLPASFLSRLEHRLRSSFSYSPIFPTPGQAVQFTGTSSGTPTSWQWDFGDGTTSNLQNPSHSFAATGFYRVNLAVSNGSGTKSIRRTITVVDPSYIASFTYSPLFPASGQAVQFTDTSTGDPTSWQWDFGDGSTTTAQNPAHVFRAKGFYGVVLTASKGARNKSVRRTVAVISESTILAAFTYSPGSPAAGQAVQYTDTSTDSPTSWQWSFGDGSTSTAQNPSHTYTTGGSKTVTLTVTNSSSSNSVTRTVTVVAALAASFSFSPVSPAAGQAVQYTDTSTGSPTSWQWDFNDGSTSTAQNPSHAYSASGSYVVTLTVTNSSGSTIATHVVNVMPASTLTASFSFSPASPLVGQSVQFQDTSAGNPTSWQWSFGDGSTSTSQNPSHAYTTAGSKTMTLTVTNSLGSSNVTRTVAVVTSEAIIINHTSIKLADIPTSWIDQTKQTLHIAYGHTSHGSQLTTGMTGLVQWKGTLYAWNSGGAGGALDLRDFNGNFGNLGIAADLGDPGRTAWEQATRTYLNQNPAINVIIWSWCGQVDGSQSDIQLYLDLMDGLDHDYPNVKFVYMTGHTNGTGLTGNVHVRNKQIRDYCLANNKILYDLEDIESYNPDGAYFGDKLVNDACDYDSNGDGVQDRNWAIDWQNAHPGEWYQCEAAHSQPLNANMKAYASWWLWARLAGWDGN